MSEPVTKTVTQKRHYDSLWKAELDADQFVNIEGTFASRVPNARDWGLTIKVTEAKITKHNPPMEKHEMDLTLEITGDEKRVDGWCTEAQKLHTFHTDAKQKLKIQPKIDDPDDTKSS
jgi:hypothetical protein